MMTLHTRRTWSVVIVTALLAGCGGGSAGDSATVGTAGDSVGTDDSTEQVADAPETTTSPATTALELPGTLVNDHVSGVAAADVARYALSESQTAQVATVGPPERFEINFLVETLADGATVDVRHETWFHDALGTSIVYRNGEVFTEGGTGIPLAVESLGATPYRAEWFTAAMTLDELLAVTEQTGYYEIPVDPAIETGSLVMVKGLMAGFEDGALRFVRAVPLEHG